MNRLLVIHRLYAQQSELPFVWGKTDCIHWCGDCALAMTGTDYIASIRGSYDSERGAREVMLRNGCADLDEVARKAFEPVPIGTAMTGDWALVQNPDGTETLGVVAGAQVVSRLLNGKLASIPIDAASVAYRVPT